MKNIAYKMPALLIITLLLSMTTYSQKQNYIGINFTEECTSNNNFQHGIGFIFERQITKRGGFETGFFIRTFTQDWVQTINTSDYNYSISNVYFTLPILYKYYSRIANVSVGPSIDYFIGWYQRNGNANINVKSYSIRPKLNYGILLKISKPIQITDKFIIEPEIRYNPIFKYYKYYLGIGIAAKYKF